MTNGLGTGNESGTPDGRALVRLKGRDGGPVWVATDQIMGLISLDTGAGENSAQDSDTEAREAETGVTQVILTHGVGLQVQGDPDLIVGIISGTLDEQGYDRALGYGDGNGGTEDGLPT